MNQIKIGNTYQHTGNGIIVRAVSETFTLSDSMRKVICFNAESIDGKEQYTCRVSAFKLHGHESIYKEFVFIHEGNHNIEVRVKAKDYIKAKNILNEIVGRNSVYYKSK